MLSKNKIKLIQSLNRKKNRDETGLFLVEGNKMVEEALRSDFTVESLVCTPEFLANSPETIRKANEIIETDRNTLQKASLLQAAQDSLALVKQPTCRTPEIDLSSELCLALDFIQDPGNLGTILRIADWFGIRTIVCSENTVDVYNPKVVQASMGAVFRVNVQYLHLNTWLKNIVNQHIPVYGTFLDGENIYTTTLSPNGVLLMGNEGNGISAGVEKLVTSRLSIPAFQTDNHKPESLNVAIATAICCSEFRRR